MAVTRKKVTRRFVSKNRISLEGLPRTCGSFFLDSGAHSLYTKWVIDPGHARGYDDYRSKKFKTYVDSYARFVKKYMDGIDFYVNVDAIFEPEISWKVLKYLENEHGLEPIPVIHYGTDLSWVHRHLEAGYKFLGIGGLGQEATRGAYLKWADDLYALLCKNKDRLPCVKTHGFAMSSYDLMVRYPWWSVDSSSWAKAAAVGSIYVPHKRKGQFTFGIRPYQITFNTREGGQKAAGQKSFYALGTLERNIVCEWLCKINVCLGSCKANGEPDEYGVASQYNARAIANLRFFQALCDWLPKWPWPFNIRPERRFF